MVRWRSWAPGHLSMGPRAYRWARSLTFVQGRSVASVRLRLAAVLTALAIAGGIVATLPRALSIGGEPPRTFLADVGPSLAILIAWIAVTARSARSAHALWALPSDLFRA